MDGLAAFRKAPPGPGNRPPGDRHDGVAAARRVDDIANAVVYLASDKLARHITGQTLVIAGGMEGRWLWRPEKWIRPSPETRIMGWTAALQMTRAGTKWCVGPALAAGPPFNGETVRRRAATLPDCIVPAGAVLAARPADPHDRQLPRGRDGLRW